MPEKLILSYADYGILIFLLLLSASIGLFFSIFGGKQKTNNDYLLAGKDMSIFPISFSLMATFLSAPTLLGIPAEMYLFGTNMAFINLGFILGPIISSFLFLPIYFKTGVSTPFEYLEKRFGKTTRRMLSIIYLLQQVLFSGVSMYAPAVALSAVTNLSMWVCVICIAAVGTVYSTLGGMKAVIWTDIFQAVLMYTCLFSIIVKGCLDLGGIDAIFKTAYDGGRILLPTFEFDFSIRYTMWSIFLQGTIIAAAGFAGNQIQVQRQLTLKTLKRSTMSSLLSIPMIVAFQILCCFCGIIFYVYFQTCDPVTSSKTSLASYDQLMPFYIISTMNEYPGLPGLCIAGIFSVSLSLISSAMNSMAAVTYQDLIKPIWKNLQKDVLITKIANIFYGFLSIFATFLVGSMGNLVKASVLVVGMVAGPALGVFLLAALTTTASEMGANIGVLVGFLFAGFVTFFPNDRYYPVLKLQSNCSENAITTANLSVIENGTFLQVNNVTDNSLIDAMSTSNIPDNFPVSFMWISSLSLLVCFTIGYFSSWIMNFIQGKSKPVATELLSPIRQRFFVEDHSVQIKQSERDVPNNNNCIQSTSL